MKETHITFYKTMPIPTFKRKSKTWMLTEEKRQNIGTAEKNIV
jgi:hypothetical protein